MTEAEIREAWVVGYSYTHLAHLTGLSVQRLVSIVNRKGRDEQRNNSLLDADVEST